jgi:hypothetical protein
MRAASRCWALLAWVPGRGAPDFHHKLGGTLANSAGLRDGERQTVTRPGKRNRRVHRDAATELSLGGAIRGTTVNSGRC